MDKLLADMIGLGVEVYLDGIIIHAASRIEHEKLVYKVFTILDINNLIFGSL